MCTGTERRAPLKGQLHIFWRVPIQGSLGVEPLLDVRRPASSSEAADMSLLRSHAQARLYYEDLLGHLLILELSKNRKWVPLLRMLVAPTS